VDLGKTRVRPARLGAALVTALATIGAMFVSSGIANVPDDDTSAAALAPAPAAASSAAVGAKARVPGEPGFMSIFTPRLILPVAVKAPSSKQARAFATLNTLVATETRFGDAIIGLLVSLDRAQASASATSAGARVWLVRQTNAGAEYALAASRLVGSFPALQAAVVQAFVADKMSLTLTPAQFAAAKAKLLRGLPASYTHLLDVVAAAYQPSTVPEVAAMKAAVLNTQPIEQALADAAPRALVLPGVLGSSSLTGPEVRLAAALKGYADTILQPVPASVLGGMSRRLEPNARLVADGEAGEQGEALHGVHEGFEGLSAVAKTFGGVAGAGAAETSFEPLGEAFGYAFAAVAFSEAGAAFDQGSGAGGEGNGAGGGSSDSAASYGEPHEMTFSGGGYAFQAAGEFTLAKSTTDNLDIQIREQRFPGEADVALDTATAMRVGDDVVEIAANKSGRLKLWVNRKAVPYGSRALSGGGKISVESPTFAKVTWPDETSVQVFSRDTIAIAHETTTCNSSDAINVIIKVAPARSGHLEGLLGDPGEQIGELVGGDRVVYSMDDLADPSGSAHNFDVLYHEFGRSWRIGQQNSLFFYPKGTSTATFTDLDFPSAALTVASLTPTTVAAAEKDCKAEGITNSDLLSDCVYDIGLTGGRDICLAGAEARVQAVTGGPKASGLPNGSGTLPPASSLPRTTTTTQPTTPTTVKPSSAGSSTPVGVGSAPSVAPAVAVDASGAAYVVWEQSSTKLSFCKLASGAKSCSPVTLEVADPTSDEFYGVPNVLLTPGHVYILDLVLGGASDLAGLNEWVSTDGGASFSLEPHAVGFVGNGGEAAGPAVELPGGDFGAGYVIPGSNPAFQANSLASPTDQSEANVPPFATLNPRPTSAYTIGNLGGVFGSQLVGSRGVLGVFEALPGKSGSPCPSTAGEALVYAYAPISPSTTPAELSSSPGGSSPWRPLAEVDCDSTAGTAPAVGGGPSGLGLLETNYGQAPGLVLVQYRHFSPSSGFGPAVTIATDEAASDGALSQDSAGEIFATWLDNTTGLDLAYSSNGGATWSKPKILFSNAGNPSGITLLGSAVGPSGQGWAVYAVGKREYAQRFSRG
jgi:hypothetical protein